MKLLCVDVGGTSVKHGIIDEELNITEKGRFVPDSTSLEAYVEALGQLYDRYRGEVEGVSFSMPGIIDPKSGYFYTGGAYDRIVHDVDLKKLLEDRTGVPVSVENDAKAAAYAELGYGCLKDIDNAVIMTLGHAIGGCLIFDHKIVYGKHYSAGELSFVNVDYHSLDFGETFAGRCGAHGLMVKVQQKLETEEELSGTQIFELANEGNEKVLEALKEFAYELCIQMYNLQVTFDPDVFALGGGISSQKVLYDLIEDGFDRMEQELFYFVRRPKVIACRFGNDANMIGAFHKYHLDHDQ
ncbi:MAG: ROK family protein [Erysipelotrichaceae bacterium]|nr:ROK family protein [Erysipelotrichaceae bacterium]MBQ6494343.1 ROK family protein [Erysipelotrichaceae bacterium]